MIKLTGPSDNIVYEMHLYLDSDGSGTSISYVSNTIGKERVAEAMRWLKQNNKVGIIGETAGGANAQCIDAIKNMLSYMEEISEQWLGWLWCGGGRSLRPESPIELCFSLSPDSFNHELNDVVRVHLFLGNWGVPIASICGCTISGLHAGCHESTLLDLGCNVDHRCFTCRRLSHHHGIIDVSLINDIDSSTFKASEIVER